VFFVLTGINVNEVSSTFDFIPPTYESPSQFS
jgi:hypothetical protein